MTIIELTEENEEKKMYKVNGFSNGVEDTTFKPIPNVGDNNTYIINNSTMHYLELDHDQNGDPGFCEDEKNNPPPPSPSPPLEQEPFRNSEEQESDVMPTSQDNSLRDSETEQDGASQKKFINNLSSHNLRELTTSPKSYSLFDNISLLPLRSLIFNTIF